jgi:hypothetical protein
VISFLTLPNRPRVDSREAIQQLDAELRSLGHLTVSPSEDPAVRAKKIAELVRSRLTMPGERTVVLLDDNGLADASRVSASVAAHGPTTLLSVAQDEHMLCSDTVKHHVAIRGGTAALLSHVTRSQYLSGAADLVVGYHDGGAEKISNIKLAAHLLTQDGLYAEIFGAPGMPGEITTLYSCDETRDIAALITPATKPLARRVQAVLGSMWQRFAWGVLEKT